MNKLHILFAIIIWIITPSLGAQNVWLQLEGSTVDKKAIDSIYTSRDYPNFSALKGSFDSIVQVLKQRGYFDLQHSGLKKANDTIYKSNFKLGNRVKFIELNFINASNELKQQLNEDSVTIRTEILSEYLNGLVERISQSGKPFYSLRLLNLKKIDQNILGVEVEDSRDETRKINAIKVRGYSNFPKSYLKNYVGIRTGEIYNKKNVLRKVRRIDHLGFAKTSKEPEVLFSKDSTIIYIYVEKASSNRFDGFIGFGTDENTNKLKLDGYLDLRLLNNLNFGESINIIYKSDELEQKTFKTDVSLPYLFATNFSLEAGLRLFKKDSTFITNNLKADIGYQIAPKHIITSGIESIISESLLNQGSSSINISDFNSFFIRTNYTYNNHNWQDQLFPLKSNLVLTAGLGNRKIDEIKTEQYILGITGHYIFDLNYNNSIFTGVNSNYLISNGYLDNELFRFGGMQSIRGFKENSIAANLFGVINTEYRYRFTNNFYAHSIIDIGYFENKIIDLKEKIFGFGIGLGIVTNSGLLRILYAVPKVGSQGIEMSDSKIHLNFSAQF
ncbi:POTRA domain-containing protein [Aegicerativicinus sediminis]|uniref:POTRA domain-containing protein n=1 Tax=Aegicerativicinus sediminis TaxID=2893202 RepID=UPI001E5C0FB0|nr:POTRA domain-containing protein [Aegicerativicinus sediminis]